MIKTCNKCKVEKTIGEFRRDNTKPDGRSYACKVCQRAYHKSKYTEKYGEKARFRNKTKRDTFYKNLNEYLDPLTCSCCSESSNVCLEFHHPDPSKKENQISHMHTYSWELVMKEINKCILVCSNCHAKIHAGLIDMGTE